MCIAIVKTQGASISDEALKNSFNNNRDGAGIAYAKDNELYYIKGIFDVKEFIKTVREVEKVAQGAILIHCRIGTSGLKDKNNCHPHVVNKKTVMIHNGILDVDVPDNSKVSDTVIYCQKILSKLPEDFMNNEAILQLIANDIGNHNKFAFLNNKGEYAIVNAKQGNWVNGVWYSNTSYAYDNTIIYKPCNYTNGYYSEWDWDDEPYAISKNKMKKLRKKIQSLTDEEMMYLGEYPIYDITNNKLISDYEEPLGQWLYLEEVSQELYWDYMEQLELRGLDVA